MRKKISKKYIAKEIGIGFLVALLATSAGCYLLIELFSTNVFEATWQQIQQEKRYSQVLTLGAIANFLPFYVFLKRKKFYRVRGVLLETFLVAFLVMYLFAKFG